jgi:nucleoside-triphosphatase
VARRVADLLRAHGFVTEEIRERGRRVGFSVERLGGERGVLAHVDLPGPPRVGRYGVDLAEFERIAIPALDEARDVAVVDELGKMELASPAFVGAVEALFARPVAVLATVLTAGHPFTDALKARDDVEVVPLRRAERDALPARLAERLSAGAARRPPR